MAEFDLPNDVPASRTAPRTWLAISLAVLAVSSGLLGLSLSTPPSPAGALVGQDLVGSFSTFGLAMTFTVVGLILRRSRDDHSIGWTMLLYGATVGVTSVFWGITYMAGLPGGDTVLGRNVAWLAVVISIPTWTYLATSLVIRFPSGRPESAHDARLLRATPIVGIAAAALAAVRPGPFLLFPSFDNPIDLPPELAGAVTLASSIGVVIALLPLTLAATSMLGRYRHASTVERLQLRWFAYAAVLAFSGALAYVVVGALLAPQDAVLREVSYVLFILAVGSLPIAVLEAITRHRLYDIDAIIGRTFAYGALTAILAGLYSASLRLFNALFSATTGQTSEAALVLTTLVLATTFTPVKSRLEHWAATRFPPQQPPQQPRDGSPPSADPHATGAELDARMEAIARRVALEVLAESEASRRPVPR